MDGQTHKLRIIEAAEKMFEKDVQTNRHIGKHGAEFILRRLKPSDKVSSKFVPKFTVNICVKFHMASRGLNVNSLSHVLCFCAGQVEPERKNKDLTCNSVFASLCYAP